MKAEVTQKYIRAVYGDSLYSVSYCGAQNLLYGLEPFAYNAGVYGWNCDYYYINGACICTGYRPHGQKVNYYTLAEYDRKAEKIRNDWNIPYADKVEQITELRNEWIATLLED